MAIIAVQIITDSTCDILFEDREKLGILVVPLTVNFAEESFRDGVDINNADFYAKLASSEHLPTTALVSPGDFTEAFRVSVEAGDEVLGLFLSSEISGTYHSACIARESFPQGKVVVLDSRSASLSLGLLVFEAVRLRDQGKSAAQIAEYLLPAIKKIRFFAAVNTLKYLRKGGRVSATSAVLGEVLGIKPIVSIINGKVVPVAKARGMAAAMQYMLQEAKKHLPDLGHCVVFAHSAAPDLMHKAIALMKGPLGIECYHCCEVGSTIGTYGGPGCVGFAYIAR